MNISCSVSYNYIYNRKFLPSISIISALYIHIWPTVRSLWCFIGLFFFVTTVDLEVKAMNQTVFNVQECRCKLGFVWIARTACMWTFLVLYLTILYRQSWIWMLVRRVLSCTEVHYILNSGIIHWVIVSAFVIYSGWHQIT